MFKIELFFHFRFSKIHSFLSGILTAVLYSTYAN